MPEYVGWGVIGKLIAVALDQLYECAVVPWTLDSAPETFVAECEIEQASYYVGPQGHGYENSDFYVTICNIFCIIDAQYFECWHSSRRREEEAIG